MSRRRIDRRMVSRLLLFAYPAEFRAAYGKELRQFLSQQRGEGRYEGVIGTFLFWKDVLKDTLTAGLRLRVRRLRGRQGGPPKVRRWRVGDTLIQDVHFGSRTLANRPLFTILASLTLGLGIGATTAIFSVIDGVLLRPLPYEDPGELVNIWRTIPRLQGDESYDTFWDRNHFSYPQYLDLTPDQVRAFLDRALRRIETISEVERVSATSRLPFLDELSSTTFTIEGRQTFKEMIEEGILPPIGQVRRVYPGFHETMGIPLLRGRTLSEADGPDALPVMVISESMARRYWPNETAIGERINFTKQILWTVVGIVGDVRHEGLDGDAEPTYYIPASQNPRRGMTLVAKTKGDPLRVIPLLREAVWSVDPDVPVTRAGTMASLVSESAVDITTDPTFSAGKPRMLFEGPYEAVAFTRDYDVTLDGQRFLMVKPVELPTQPVTHINVVLNWFEELERLVPTN